MRNHSATNSLPAGWVRTTVRDVFEVVGGGTPPTSVPSYWTGNIPWITSADIEGVREISPRKSISEDGVRHSATNVVPAHTIVVVTRVGLGKVGLAGRPLAFSQDCQGLISDPHVVNPEFAAYQLLQRVQAFRYISRGTTIGGVTKKQLLDLPFDLAPTAEQRRIVAAIEEQFSRIDAGVQALERTRRNLQRMLAAVLQSGMTGRLVPQDPSDERAEVLLKRITERRKKPWKGAPHIADLPPLPESWTWTFLGHVFDVFVGTTPSRSNPRLWNGSVPWVSSGEVAFSRIAVTRETIVEEALGDPRTRLHPPGTVMLAMIGEGKTRGQAAILDIAAAHNQNCAAIRVSETEVMPEYVFFVLMHRYEETRRLASGGNQPALNKARVEGIPLPLPPVGEQRRIVNEIERQFSFIDAAASAVERDLEKSSMLKKSVLRDAFAGRLVPHDPWDEPANILLDRIKSTRDGDQLVNRYRRRSRR